MSDVGTEWMLIKLDVEIVTISSLLVKNKN